MTNFDKRKSLFRHFLEEAERTLLPTLEHKKDIFPSYSTLINRYRDAGQRVLQKGVPGLQSFHEAHNEVCTTAAVLEEASVKRVEYEPKINNCKKKFDFHISMADGLVRIMEVKTIHPISKNDWAKFKAAGKKDLFPDNTYFLLSEEGLGGELYHNSYAARGKMLYYTMEMEDKIESCFKNLEEIVTFLVFFMDGFDWHLDELEDFVFFYRSGRHFPDDPFAVMEDDFIQKEGIVLKKVIQYFSCLRRPNTAIRPSEAPRPKGRGIFSTAQSSCAGPCSMSR
jgi:hypothetical protein